MLRDVKTFARIVAVRKPVGILSMRKSPCGQALAIETDVSKDVEVDRMVRRITPL